MPTGKDIIIRAGRLLQDEDHTRWTCAELADWINEAVRAIVLSKPSASTRTKVLTLQAGTLQHVPVSGSPTPLMLVKLVRNLRSQVGETEPRLGGRIITPTSQNLLDADSPNWHDSRSVPYKAEVRQYCYDEANPLDFYVYPGNNGDGVVEAVISVLPPSLTASGDASLEASYAGDIGLPEPYSVPVLDYVMWRAQAKDDIAANAGRAAIHFQAFASAIGMKIKVEGATSPNTKRDAP